MSIDNKKKVIDKFTKMICEFAKIVGFQVPKQFQLSSEL